jgi:hypothetical protein
MDRGPHTLHQCHTPEEFTLRLEALTGRSIRQLTDQVVAAEAPKAIFVVGSLPLGMGASGSDVDLIVMVDSKAALLNGDGRVANDTRQLEFYNESESLLAGIFLNMNAGILIDLQVALTPTIHAVYSRLRRRGPELSETEIRILGRLSTGWLLWESEGYLERHRVVLNDPALAVYCCTTHFVSGLHQESKSFRALECEDTALALQHGRSAIELAYLAYLASEGLTYLGSKWLAQLGYARGAAERLERYPVLKQGIPLLFPSYTTNPAEVARYLRSVSEYLRAMRSLIEQKTLFRIAFSACPQARVD